MFTVTIQANSAEDLRLKCMEMAAQFLRINVRDQLNPQTGKVTTTQEKVDAALAKVHEREKEAKLPLPEEVQTQPTKNSFEPKRERGKPGRKPKPKPEAENAAAQEGAQAAPQSTEIPLTPPAQTSTQLEMPVDQPPFAASSSPSATKDDAIKALSALNEAKGFEAAREALEKLGAKRMGEVKPEKYGELVEICKQMVG